MPLELPLFNRHRMPVSDTALPWLLVLLHGVGSNEEDLYGLAPSVPPQFHVLSLRAPYTLGRDSYGWFTFVVQPNGVRTINQEQEAASRSIVATTVTSAAEQLAVPADRVVVGGFSQGGIMSLSLLLTQPDLVTAAMVMHSRLLPEVVPHIAPAEALRRHRVWVSHGTDDGVIPLANAREIRRRLSGLPIDLSYAEFPGGHEIRAAELTAAMAWLDAPETS